MSEGEPALKVTIDYCSRCLWVGEAFESESPDSPSILYCKITGKLITYDTECPFIMNSY